TPTNTQQHTKAPPETGHLKGRLSPFIPHQRRRLRKQYTPPTHQTNPPQHHPKSPQTQGKQAHKPTKPTQKHPNAPQ
ncbi:hypothetical protein, partial [Paenarthrobacter sp. NPDC058040]|uniref:hypothetical protein n=1 Tax=unclassified Paenarthrobacter TaxID=2634190 RepID=UPI0036D8D54C